MRHLVLLQPQDTGGYQATAPGLPGCQSEGATEEEALANIRQVIVETLQRVKIATVDIPDSVSSDPWTQVIGLYADEANEPSQFEEFQDAMDEYRRELNRTTRH